MECQAHTDPLPSHLQSNQTSASRLQVSKQNDWGSSRRKSREGSTNPARHSHAELQSSGCCSRGWPSTRHSWDCCWAQNNDFTLSMPHPQSTTVCATQRLIHAPAGFVGCYSLVLCMERHSIRKSFHTDAGSLILPLGRERTEWYVGVYPVQAEQAGPRYRLMCWHGSSCRHCRAPLRLGTSGSSSTNHGTERGCFRVQHMQVPRPTPQPPPNAQHWKIPYKGTCSYHHFTSTLSHGAVEYLPRDLWANSVRKPNPASLSKQALPGAWPSFWINAEKI